MNKKFLIAPAVLGVVAVSVIGLVTFHNDQAAKSEKAKSEKAKIEKPKIDPTTGDGTPWTIVWNGRDYSYTWQSGNRQHRTFNSYSEAVQEMIWMQQEMERTWKVAPEPTVPPRASPTPTPTTAASGTPGAVGPTTFYVTSTFSNWTTPSTPPPVWQKTHTLYGGEKRGPWFGVIPLDPEYEPIDAPENVRIESKYRPFVTENAKAGIWTIEFVKPPLAPTWGKQGKW